MKVEFRTNQLRGCYEDSRAAVRVWGIQVEEDYVIQVSIILDPASLDDLLALQSLRVHPLTGNRRGQFAMTLAGRWRLIFSVQEDATIVIEEVSNHYDQ